jgi:hypothetical protein
MQHTHEKHKCIKNFCRKACTEETVRDLGVDRRIILKWIFKLHLVSMWTEFIWLKIKPSNGIFWVPEME